MSSTANARAALLLLTALNFLNYIDRNVLFAVQPLIQKEFHLNDEQIGFLTTAFFICYMVAAPLFALLVDGYVGKWMMAAGGLMYEGSLRRWTMAAGALLAGGCSRKWIMAAGAFTWSLATLLSAVTHSYGELLLRHIIVGIGEATFVAISPAFLSDLFPETIRGRVMGFFYMATPVGSALGYIIGGYLGHLYGWRAPFLISALPGLLLAFGVVALREPVRGASDHVADSVERGTLLGLLRNQAYWTITLGAAMMTFAIGGLQVWMPTFLTRIRQVPLDRANAIFGGMTLITGIVATLFGGWLGDRLLQRTPAAYQLLSGVGMALSIPAIVMAVYSSGPVMYPAIFLGEFLLLLNTAPLNAALVNSVSARLRATALAVNIFTIHLLGDAFSPTLIGYISDRSNLKMGLTSMVFAVALSAVVLFYGMRFAPRLEKQQLAVSS